MPIKKGLLNEKQNIVYLRDTRLCRKHGLYIRQSFVGVEYSMDVEGIKIC
jgi:hypothetical protein